MLRTWDGGRLSIATTLAELPQKRGQMYSNRIGPMQLSQIRGRRNVSFQTEAHLFQVTEIGR